MTTDMLIVTFCDPIMTQTRSLLLTITVSNEYDDATSSKQASLLRLLVACN